MDEDFIVVALLSTLGIGSAAVVVGAWLPKGKKLPDWFMAVGGTMALVAFGVVVAGMMGWLPPGMHGDRVIIPTLSAIALGVLLFSMGYVMDRWRCRQVQTHDREIP